MATSGSTLAWQTRRDEGLQALAPGRRRRVPPDGGDAGGAGGAGGARREKRRARSARAVGVDTGTLAAAGRGAKPSKRRAALRTRLSSLYFAGTPSADPAHEPKSRAPRSPPSPVDGGSERPVPPPVCIAAPACPRESTVASTCTADAAQQAPAADLPVHTDARFTAAMDVDATVEDIHRRERAPAHDAAGPAASPSASVPKKTRRRARATSSYFAAPPPAPSPRRPRPKAKAPTFSPHFSITSYNVDLNKAVRGVRTAAGISTPWPPLTAPRFGLIQEELTASPFQVIVSTVFLNRTRGTVAVPLLRTFLAAHPTPAAVATADEAAIEALLQPLGLQRTRARRLVAMASAWVAQPPVPGSCTVKKDYPPRKTVPFPALVVGAEPLGVPRSQGWEVAHIPGVGPYALDSWRIWCRDELRGDVREEEEEWRRVVPMDKELRAFLRWKWAKEGRRWVEEGDDAGTAEDAAEVGMEP